MAEFQGLTATIVAYYCERVQQLQVILFT